MFPIIGAAVLVSDLDILDMERFGVAVGGALRAPVGRGRPHGVFQRVQRILNVFAEVCVGDDFVRPAALAAHAGVDHVDRPGAQILGQLQTLMKTQPAGGVIPP